MREQRGRLRKILGHARVIKEHVKNIDTIIASDKTIVWFLPQRFRGDMIAGRLASLPDVELKSACMASRIFGGYIADDEWLAACEEMHPV